MIRKKTKVRKNGSKLETGNKGKMAMNGINKSLFAQLNDKRFYFADSIISLPEELRQYKKDSNKKIELLIQENRL